MTRIVLVLALLLGSLVPATAASVSVVSMQYSAAQPIPHLHYDGPTTVGDVASLKQVFDAFVKCRLECLGPDGSSTAILTMNGPGGAYSEGLALADFLRANHIATVVEAGSYCYSACAFGFLGGSGYSSMDGLGTYIDRQIEPGGIVGFHAPYRDEASFLQALEERGAGELMGESRDSLSLMVRELVKWNVDPEIIHYMLGRGPDQTYDITGADDYFLIRAALPPTPASGWITDLPTAVKNACIRLLAIDERGDPLNFRSFFDQLTWQDNLGTDSQGRTVSGYHWSDRVLDIGSCGTPAAAAGVTGDMSVALYFTPGIDGTITPDTSYFNIENGWSTAGKGRNPVKRILQKGPMNHYWLPVGVTVDSLDLPGELAILQNRFFTAAPPPFASMDPELQVATTRTGSRISHIGDVWVFEQVGPRSLYDAALNAPLTGLEFSNNAVGSGGFVRVGTYPDGTPLSWIGFVSGDTATVIKAFVSNVDGSPASDEQIALLRRIRCAADFQGLKLGCG